MEMYCLRHTSPAKFFNTTALYNIAEKRCFSYVKAARVCEVTEAKLHDLFAGSTYGKMVSAMKKHQGKMAPEAQLKTAQTEFIAGRKKIVEACDLCVGQHVSAYHSLYTKEEHIDAAKDDTEKTEKQAKIQEADSEEQKEREQSELKEAEKEARRREKQEQEPHMGGCTVLDMAKYCFRSTRYSQAV
jgi:hypothetical protein